MANEKNPDLVWQKSSVAKPVGSVRKNTSKKPTKPVETIQDFARRTGQNYIETPAEVSDRVKLSAINFPKNIRNMSALRFALRVSDALIITAIILVVMLNAYVGINDKALLAPLAAGILGAIGFCIALYIVKAHHFPPIESYSQHMGKVTLGSMAANGVWLSISLIAKPDTFLPDFLAIAGLVATGILLILHSFYYAYIHHYYKKGEYIPTIVMLGATDAARRLIEENARTRELNILAIFDERLSRAPHNIHGVPVVGRIQDMLGWDALPFVDRIVVTLPEMASDRKKAFVEQVRKLPNRIAFVVDEFEHLDHVQQRLSQIAQIGMHEVTGKQRSGLHFFLKRTLDITVSATALLFGLPLLIIVAILIMRDSKGPIFFKQNRHGFNNSIFEVLKFRSLRVEVEDKDAKSQVTANDNRVTKIGRFIRKTSIDELPQLINVLKGDMSLVGPRPHAVGMHTGDTETYKLVDDYAHRHKVKPGLTGWAQINGSRGPLHNADSVARRVQLDMEYIERSNIFFDLMIILKTVPCLLGDSDNIR